MGPIVSKIKIEYFLVGIVVALTGFEFMFRASIIIQFAILSFIALYFIFQGKKFNNKFFLIVIPFMIPLLFQAFQMGSLYAFYSNGLAFIIRFLISYLVYEIVKKRFHITFVGLIYFLALVSFIFFPTQFFPPLREFIKNGIGSIIQPIGTEGTPEGFRSHTLIFFTYMHSYGHGIKYLELRNCGPFWEPGMFAVFLNIAFLINVHINKTALFSKKNIVFIIAILTTVSTTGYIGLFIVLFSKYIVLKDIYKLIYAPLLLIFLYFTYTYVWTLDFMENKIEKNIQGDYDRRSRFGAILYHFDKLKESPVTGVALSVAAKERTLDFTDRLVSPNGLSLIFFFWGIPAGILYYILFYKGIRRWLLSNNIKDKSLCFLFYFLFLFMAFSQDVTLRYFYLMILFFTLYDNRRFVRQLKITNYKYGTI